MSDKIRATQAGSAVKKSQLKQLVDNYYKVMKKTDDTGEVVDLDPKKDAKSVWFTKAAIDKLFATHGCTAENNDEFGLRIYFAVHQTGILYHDEIPGHYHNQQTVILVPTKNQDGFMDHDLLKEDDEILLGDEGKGDPKQQGGGGLNHGKICPPDTDCGCVI